MNSARAVFIFWTAADSWLSRLIIRITGRKLPDRSDAWSHMGLGFLLDNHDKVYYEALFSAGFDGPRDLCELQAFARKSGNRLALRPLDDIPPAQAQIIHQACNTLVGRTGYYAAQLVYMWLFERAGRFFGCHLRTSPNRVVCSEAVAQLLFPALDLRDEVRRSFDEVNPNSAWRKFRKLREAK